jgi:hypothetical protein
LNTIDNHNLFITYFLRSKIYVVLTNLDTYIFLCNWIINIVSRYIYSKNYTSRFVKMVYILKRSEYERKGNDLFSSLTCPLLSPVGIHIHLCVHSVVCIFESVAVF